MQGMGVIFANRFCFTSRDNAWNRRPPAGISNLPVSVPSSAKTGPHAQALQEAAAGDVFGQFLDGHASLDAPHVGLAQHQLVERDIP